MHGLIEPNHRHANYSNSLEQGSDRVGDGRGGRKNDEGNDVLAKVDTPVEDEVIKYAVWVRMAFRWMGHMIRR